MTKEKRLYRSQKDKKVAGVFGGLGEYLDTDPTILRIAWVVVTVLTGIVPGILGYILVAVIMPSNPNSEGV